MNYLKMKIQVSRYSGFCSGVQKALKILDGIVQEGGKKAYTAGPIVHNPQVVEYYRQRGIEPLDETNSLPPDALVVIRAHGITLAKRENLVRRGATVLDATCALVHKVHEIIEAERAAGKFVYIAGSAEHPEVEVHLDLCRGRGMVLESAGDAVALKRLESPAALVAQTTFSDREFRRIREELIRRDPSIAVHDTICPTPRRAREYAGKLAEEVDVMLVVGGRSSSNTRRLAETCAAAGVATYQVETAEELRKEWFDGVEKIGVAAGTSTPPGSIDEIRAWLKREFDTL
ncbi:MAG: 4-hydroxy-3-methylbut-2-enyl diphosphate reductase [bacterium]